MWRLQLSGGETRKPKHSRIRKIGNEGTCPMYTGVQMVAYAQELRKLIFHRDVDKINNDMFWNCAVEESAFPKYLERSKYKFKIVKNVLFPSTLIIICFFFQLNIQLINGFTVGVSWIFSNNLKHGDILKNEEKKTIKLVGSSIKGRKKNKWRSAKNLPYRRARRWFWRLRRVAGKWHREIPDDCGKVDERKVLSRCKVSRDIRPQREEVFPLRDTSDPCLLGKRREQGQLQLLEFSLIVRAHRKCDGKYKKDFKGIKKWWISIINFHENKLC